MKSIKKTIIVDDTPDMAASEMTRSDGTPILVEAAKRDAEGNVIADTYARKIDAQVPLHSGYNIKTINGESVLGPGNIEIKAADDEAIERIDSSIEAIVEAVNEHVESSEARFDDLESASSTLSASVETLANKESADAISIQTSIAKEIDDRETADQTLRTSIDALRSAAIPTAPSAAGSYVLRTVVDSSGNSTVRWDVADDAASVVANPDGDAAKSLTKIEIGGVIYSIDGGADGDSFIRGYYFNGNFYSDDTYTEDSECIKSNEAVYLDISTGNMYKYYGDIEGFKQIDTIEDATDSLKGILKLYAEPGSNEDGAMTQKSITEGVSNISFAVDSGDEECLVLSNLWSDSASI